jgi:hypothetical protein
MGLARVYTLTILITFITLNIYIGLYGPKYADDDDYVPQRQQQKPSIFLDKKEKDLNNYNDSRIHFTDTELAKKIFMKLDKDYLPQTNKKKKSKNPYYCFKAMKKFVKNPQAVFDDIIFQSNYKKDMLPYEVMEDFGTHIMWQKKNKAMKWNYDTKAHYFFHQHHYMTMDMHVYNMICPHQLHNHLKASPQITDKAKVALDYYKYSERFANNSQEECHDQVMTNTYVLYNKKLCTAFFEYLNTTEYKELKSNQIPFMQKLGAGHGSHGARGVQPFDDAKEAIIKEVYANGSKCGEIKDNTVMQGFIANPLLIKKHKFDIRSYVTIVSGDPLIVYYHDGPLRASLFEFDPESNDTTNLLSNNLLKGPENMTDEERQYYLNFNMSDLGQYLYDEGKIHNVSWLEDGLRLQMKKSYVHLMRAAKNYISTNPSYYEMLGCDFLLDDDLKAWFIECNNDPTLNYPHRFNNSYLIKPMLKDHFEVMAAYHRSRITRVINFVNRLIEDLHNEKLTMKEVKSMKKEEFEHINKHRLEPEFKLSKNNGWIKIVDENFDGPEKFGNLFPSECTLKK